MATLFHDDVVNYLKEKANGKLTLIPEQLESVIDVSVKQQSKLRLEDKFPIPYRKIGKNIHYSIFHVADFLLNGEISKNPYPDEKIKVSKETVKKANNNSQNLSHIFSLRALISHIEEDAKKQQNLAVNLIAVADSTEMKYRLESKLKIKS